MSIREAIQAFLDQHGDGWNVSQFVIVMGLERITDGTLESTPWVWAPAEQPDWMTTALLEEGIRQRDAADIGD